MTTNAIHTIFPYKLGGQWMFDDEKLDIHREPFVGGADDLIETVTDLQALRSPENGFRMVFSAQKFKGFELELNKQVDEDGLMGNTYTITLEIDDVPVEMDGWLCPVLEMYIDPAPAQLFVKVVEMSKEEQLEVVGQLPVRQVAPSMLAAARETLQSMSPSKSQDWDDQKAPWPQPPGPTH